MFGRIASAVVIASTLVVVPAAGVHPIAVQEPQTTPSGLGWDRIPELVAEVAPSVVTVLTDQGEAAA